MISSSSSSSSPPPAAPAPASFSSSSSSPSPSPTWRVSPQAIVATASLGRWAGQVWALGILWSWCSLCLVPSSWVFLTPENEVQLISKARPSAAVLLRELPDFSCQNSRIHTSCGNFTCSFEPSYSTPFRCTCASMPFEALMCSGVMALSPVITSDMAWWVENSRIFPGVTPGFVKPPGWWCECSVWVATNHYWSTRKATKISRGRRTCNDPAMMLLEMVSCGGNHPKMIEPFQVGESFWFSQRMGDMNIQYHPATDSRF